jgi:hypothetical protein
MERLMQLMAQNPELKERFLAMQNDGMGADIDQALAMSKPKQAVAMPSESPTARRIMGAVAPGEAPMPEADYSEPEPGLLGRISSALGIGGAAPSQDDSMGSAQARADHVKQLLESRGSLGNKLLRGLGGALAGASGRGVGEITNAQRINDQAELKEAQMMNLVDPNSQISSQFRELAKMYSSPEEFTVTDDMSADAILEAMPWLAKKIGLDQSAMGLGLKDKALSMRGRGGGGQKLKPLGEVAEREIADKSNTIEAADYLIDKVRDRADLVGKSTSTLQKGLGTIPFVNVQDPEWIQLEGEIKAFTKAYLKSMEGARPSDYDAVSYEKITGNQFNSADELQRLIQNLKKSATNARKWKLETAKRNKKDVSGFEDMMGEPSKQQASGFVTFEIDGKKGRIPVAQAEEFQRKYPKAKRVD